MLQAFVITLREGLEAFLISPSAWHTSARAIARELIPAVHWGIGASVLLSIAAGWLFYQARNQALWEGILALGAAVSVASLTVHMWRTARRIKKDIEGRLHTSAMKSRRRGVCRRLPFTLLMITREGMETALLMGTLLFQIKAVDWSSARSPASRSRRSSPRSGRATAIA